MLAVIDTTDPLNDDEPRLGDLVADPDASSIEQLNRLAMVVAAMRAVLDDPVALMGRAAELLAGTAKPLFVFALVGIATVRMVGGPATPGYFTLAPRHRAAPVTVASVAMHERELA